MEEAKRQKEEKVREKEVRTKEVQARRAQKAMENAKDLEAARKILSRHGSRRQICDRYLACHHVELLLIDMGMKDEAYARNGKRLLQEDLRTLFWHHHVHNHSDTDPNTSSESDNTDTDPDTSPESDNTNTHSDDDSDKSSWDSDAESDTESVGLFDTGTDTETNPDTNPDTNTTNPDTNTTNPDTNTTTDTNTTDPDTNTTDPDTTDTPIPMWNGSDEDIERHSEAVPFGVGCKVRVYWPAPTKKWYAGKVTGVDQSDATYEVFYPGHGVVKDEKIWHDLTWKAQLIE